MPNNNFLMSLGVILLAILWLYAPGLKNGWKSFKENKPALMMAGLFLIHILWLVNTSNFDYAFKDLRIKLPLFVLAVVIGSIPISRKQVKLIFLALSVGVGYATVSGYIRYFNFSEGMYDYREIVQGISHIRLSLLMVLLVMAVAYFRKELTGFWKIYAILVVLNTLVFFNLAQMATGSIILAIAVVGAIFYRLYTHFSKRTFTLSLIVVLALLALGVKYSVNYYNQYFTPKNERPAADEKTALGNSYSPELFNHLVENGNRHFDFYNKEEMIEAWNERSNVKIGEGTNNSEVNHTLIRYLTSKGLRKDHEGVMALTEADVKNIENGFPNEIYAYDSGLNVRFHSFLFGVHVYKATGRVTGSSFMQRLLYWEVTWKIIRQYWLLGVGTGDIKDEIASMHQKIYPDLEEQYRLRTHNQFLTFFASFGIIGLLYFLATFGYAFHLRKTSFIAVMFLLIAFVSCISEDTLETQAGVTFFSFFYALFSKPFTGNTLSRKRE